VTGLLVEPRNVVQLANAICHLMDSPDVRYEMGHAALDRFYSHFTSKIALINYTNMYTKLFEARQ